MVALAPIDITTPAPVVRATTKPAQIRQHSTGDPLIDATTRLLTAPMQQAYALLWRAGLLVVDR